MQDLAGQVALITGASQGIGQATARVLAKHGMKLVLSARSKDKLNVLADELRNQHPDLEILVAPADVSRPAQVEAVVKETLRYFGQIDALVNNAGVAAKIALLQEIPLEEIDRTIDTNLKGAIYMMRAVLPSMIERQSGTIININSIAGKAAFPYWSIYDASKFGLRAVTEAVADEQRSNNIRVVGIYPGAVDTPIWETIELNHEPNHEGMLDAGTIAESIVYVLSQPQKVHISDITLSPLKPVL